mgnify:FL=1
MLIRDGLVCPLLMTHEDFRFTYLLLYIINLKVRQAGDFLVRDRKTLVRNLAFIHSLVLHPSTQIAGESTAEIQ